MIRSSLLYAHPVCLPSHQYHWLHLTAHWLSLIHICFKGLTPEQEKAVKEYKSSQSIDIYNELFKKADFPLDSGTFPESFSYEVQGELYISIPVPHALGDYAIVVFTPETK